MELQMAVASRYKSMPPKCHLLDREQWAGGLNKLMNEQVIMANTVMHHSTIIQWLLRTITK